MNCFAYQSCYKGNCFTLHMYVLYATYATVFINLKPEKVSSLDIPYQMLVVKSIRLIMPELLVAVHLALRLISQEKV